MMNFFVDILPGSEYFFAIKLDLLDIEQVSGWTCLSLERGGYNVIVGAHYIHSQQISSIGYDFDTKNFHTSWHKWSTQSVDDRNQ
jgi:hypothetical protein